MGSPGMPWKFCRPGGKPGIDGKGMLNVGGGNDGRGAVGADVGGGGEGGACCPGGSGGSIGG